MNVALLHAPRLTLPWMVAEVKELWGIDLELPEEQGGPLEPYLRDDLFEVLQGGIFAIAYPTDYGKSTLIEMSVVLSLELDPTALNTIVKATKDVALLAAQVCFWKLRKAAARYPWCKPMGQIHPQTGNPMVREGFWVAGSRREEGTRDRSVYPAGIGDTSLPGRRGRTHIDDVEIEEIAKSRAKHERLQTQINGAVRLIQDTPDSLWLLAGTPQVANSILFVVQDELKILGKKFKAIFRPEVVQHGPHAGKLLWSKRKLKSEVQRRLMDVNAHRIAYSLKPPGSGKFDGEEACELIKDPDFFRSAAQSERRFREYVFGRLYMENQRKVGLVRWQRESDLWAWCQRTATEDLALYIWWDPATVGTYSVGVLAMLPESRWVLDVVIDSGSSDDQAIVIREIRRRFPSATVVIENNGQQESFITILQAIDPEAMIVPHTTSQNKASEEIGLPGMMAEFMLEDAWHLPWDDQDSCQERFDRFLLEVRRWGPGAHPHALAGIWFAWHWDLKAGAAESLRAHADQREQALSRGEDPDVQEFGVIIPLPGLRDPLPSQRREPGVSPEAEEAWNRRWQPFR